MTKYIELEAAYKFMFDIPNPYGAGEIEVVSIDDLDTIPTADVVPVRYGCWNADKEDIEWGNSLIRYRCSVCNERPHFDKEEYKFILSPYCPNCGAKMDGDRDV